MYKDGIKAPLGNCLKISALIHIGKFHRRLIGRSAAEHLPIGSEKAGIISKAGSGCSLSRRSPHCQFFSCNSHALIKNIAGYRSSCCLAEYGSQMISAHKKLLCQPLYRQRIPQMAVNIPDYLLGLSLCSMNASRTSDAPCVIPSRCSLWSLLP